MSCPYMFTYVYMFTICLDIYTYVMYIQYVFMFYVSVLRRICVHELPLYVYLERFGANLFMGF